MEGRGAGTAGLDAARDYIADRFRSAGLEPAFKIDGQPSYTQPFEIKLGVVVREQSLSAGGGEAVAAIPEQAFNAMGFSGSGSFEGPAVFVGYGIVNPDEGYDSYRGVPGDGLKGKVAVAFRYEPQDSDGKSLWAGRGDAAGPWTESASLLKKAQWAAQHGAAALLVVNPPSQDQGDLKSTQRSMGEESSPVPVLHVSAAWFDGLIGLTGRDAGKVVQAYQRRANQGVGAPELLAGVTVRGRVELEHPKAMVHNVAGVLRGRGALADEVVVVGAHYDHLGYGEIGSLAKGQDKGRIHPGADDNASGVAAVVLLAERFISLQRPADAGGPRRTLLFIAFSGEERGLLGSSYTLNNLDQLGVEQEQIVAMVNFDMIGRMRGRKLYAMGLGTGDGFEQLLDRANEPLGLNLRNDAQSFGGSDHASFQFREVPAVHLFTGSHSDYHRPSDTVDKVNAEGGVLAVALAERVIEMLDTQPERMAFVAPPGGASHGAVHGSGAYLGVMPDYSSLDGDEGCMLAGTVPNGPAKAAGLQSGDTILTWNGKPVRNVRGLMTRLGEDKPGDEVVLQVRRDGKLIKLTVTLGRR